MNSRIGKRLSESHKRNISLSIKGLKNPNWKGGRFITSHGYVKVYYPGHPNAMNNYIYEHRAVMEKHLGRFLDKRELVHHINHEKTDNRIENLRIVTPSQHTILHAQEKVKTGVVSRCDVCRRATYRFMCWDKRSKGNYCSRECVAVGKTNKVSLKCTKCKKAFVKTPSNYTATKTHWCSPACWYNRNK